MAAKPASRTTGKTTGRRPAPRKRASSGATAQSARPSKAVRIGVISDTHGYLDPRVLELFAGVSHIIHAGDVMNPKILRQLEAIAPLTAVAGNLDRTEVVGELPREVISEVDGIRFVVGHKPKRLLKRIAEGKISVDGLNLVVWGHEHVPTATWIEGVLHLNPGTASAPEEEDDGPTVAIVERTPAGLSVLFYPLEDRRGGEQSKT
jgi:putative phosphoesterase